LQVLPSQCLPRPEWSPPPGGTCMLWVGRPWIVSVEPRLQHAVLTATRSPPQHHPAFPGWCIFNDQAVAARAAQRDAGVERVLFVDLDVHQGDGTAAIFADGGCGRPGRGARRPALGAGLARGSAPLWAGAPAARLRRRCTDAARPAVGAAPLPLRQAAAGMPGGHPSSNPPGPCPAPLPRRPLGLYFLGALPRPGCARARRPLLHDFAARRAAPTLVRPLPRAHVEPRNATSMKPTPQPKPQGFPPSCSAATSTSDCQLAPGTRNT
jgi:hypothetical protein